MANETSSGCETTWGLFDGVGRSLLTAWCKFQACAGPRLVRTAPDIAEVEQCDE